MARGVDLLVATPGRLLDLIDSGSLTLSSVRVLVLDEADRMLDLGFIHTLRRIEKLSPRQRQTLLFSATMPRPIAVLAEDYLSDPVKVVVAPAATTVERAFWQSAEKSLEAAAADRLAVESSNARTETRRSEEPWLPCRRISDRKIAARFPGRLSRTRVRCG